MAVVALDVIQDLSQVARTSRPVFKSSSEPAFTRSTTMVIQIVFHFVSQNDNLAGTITPQHMLLTRKDVFKDTINANEAYYHLFQHKM